MLRQRDGAAYAAWRTTVLERGLPELMSFVGGLDRDQEAVLAGLTLKWSNGPTEGQVNRLKTVKRQMYGRATFDLLRKRVLHAG
jgi:transposase